MSAFVDSGFCLDEVGVWVDADVAIASGVGVVVVCCVDGFAR